MGQRLPAQKVEVMAIGLCGRLVGDKASIGPMWKALMKTIDLEPPIPLQSNVYLGCKQEPEIPDKGAIQQKAQIFQGFFMNKHAQDDADAKLAPRKREHAHDDADSVIAPRNREHAAKTLLKEEKCLIRKHGNDKSTTNNIKIIGYNYSMCGHVEQCVEKYLELAGKKVADLRQVGTPCIDDHDITSDGLVSRGVLAEYSARIG